MVRCRRWSCVVFSGCVTHCRVAEDFHGKDQLPYYPGRLSAKAKPVNVTVNDVRLSAVVKEFSTGSLGWYLNGKTTIDVGGTPVSVQIGMNLTIVGSKELPKDAGHGAASATEDEVA